MAAPSSGITGLLHGIAEQRDFLLRQATAETVLYLDDDVLMETWVLERLLTILRREVRLRRGVSRRAVSSPRSATRAAADRLLARTGARLRSSSRRARRSAGSCTGRRTSITSPSRYRRSMAALQGRLGRVLHPLRPPQAGGGGALLAAAASLSLRGGGPRPESPHATLGRLRHGPIRDVLSTGADNRLKRPRQRRRPRARPAAGDDRALRHRSRRLLIASPGAAHSGFSES